MLLIGCSFNRLDWSDPACQNPDYKASQKLGITRAMYSHYRTGRKTPSDEILDKMAEISNITPAKVYLAAYAEKLNNP